MKTWAQIAILALGLGLGASACHRRSATPDDCLTILDRIVSLELGELGFRDPALVARKTEEMRAVFAKDLARCQGVGMRRGAIDCVRAARSTEELSHRCLR